MKKRLIYTAGLALAMPCAGILGFQSVGAAQDQAQPNAAQPGQVQPNPAPADQNQNPAPVQNQAAPNPAPANPGPSDQLQNPTPANPNAAPANPAPAAPPDQNQPTPTPPGNLTAPGTNTTSGAAMNAGQANGASTMAAPVYYSPLQQFASQQEDEVGMLSRQIDQFRAAKQPQAVMALYHMIRDHQLVVDAARNVLARRGDVATLSLNPMPPSGSDPQAIYQEDIQAHQQAIDQLQQMIANTDSPAEKNIYQQALTAANRHVQWLQALNQGQTLQIGFFGPTVPLDRIAGYREQLNSTAANGYPQPRVQQAASRQNGTYTRRATRRYRSSRRYRARRSQQTSY
jgi:hypothetical protein